MYLSFWGIHFANRTPLVFYSYPRLSLQALRTSVWGEQANNNSLESRHSSSSRRSSCRRGTFPHGPTTQTPYGSQRALVVAFAWLQDDVLTQTCGRSPWTSGAAAAGSISVGVFRLGQAKTKGALRFRRGNTEPERDRRRFQFDDYARSGAQRRSFVYWR